PSSGAPAIAALRPATNVPLPAPTDAPNQPSDRSPSSVAHGVAASGAPPTKAYIRPAAESAPESWKRAPTRASGRPSPFRSPAPLDAQPNWAFAESPTHTTAGGLPAGSSPRNR